MNVGGCGECRCLRFRGCQANESTDPGTFLERESPLGPQCADPPFSGEHGRRIGSRSRAHVRAGEKRQESREAEFSEQ